MNFTLGQYMFKLIIIIIICYSEFIFGGVVAKSPYE